MAHPTRSVANVNVNGGEPNANVYEFSHRDVWNANYRNRVFSLKLPVSPSFSWGSFLFKSFFPTSKHTANFFQAF